jgi:hypothetical protein
MKRNKKVVILSLAPFILCFSIVFTFIGWMSYIDASVQQTCADYYIEDGMDRHTAELRCHGL